MSDLPFDSRAPSSLSPVLEPPHAKVLAGNEFIDEGRARGYEFPPQAGSYDERDLTLYALGVGAGQGDLSFVYEGSRDFRALPTFGVIPALKVIFEMAAHGTTAPGLNYSFDRILHGEQYTALKRPLPTRCKLTHRAKIKDIFDKGRSAVVITSITTYDESDEELVYNEITTFVRGAGGWGGSRGPATVPNVAPERAPDAVVTEATSENQALLYRLSGDTNPLHVDPEFAKTFGFRRPILHGLCTFGFAARHIIKEMLHNNTRDFKSIRARFSDTVFPGETLVTEIWKETDTKIAFRCKTKERDKIVISNGEIELYGHERAPSSPATP